MNEKTLHELALAFATVKLQEYQKEHSTTSSDSKEVDYFLKMYKFALDNLENEYQSLD